MKAALVLSAGVLIASGTAFFGCSGQGGETHSALYASPDSLKVVAGDKLLADLSFLAWGPNWGWTGWEGQEGKARARLSTGAVLSVDSTLGARGGELVWDISSHSDKDTDLTLATLSIAGGPDTFGGGKLSVVDGGKATEYSYPIGREPAGQRVSQITIVKGANKLEIFLDPPQKLVSDGGLRVVLAEGSLKGGQAKKLRVTVRTSGSLRVVNETPDAVPGWFPWTPAQDGTGRDELSMADWLEAPAGKSGRIQRKGDDLVLNGQPVKLWGLNLCYSNCSPDKELADRRAAFYARNGINAVRLHKYADGPGWAGIQSPGSFETFEPQALDRMDYFVSKLKEKGIYTKLSSTFIVTVGREDITKVPFASELGAMGPEPDARIRVGHGAVFLSEEIQDLQIRQIEAILKHKNPYSGLTYAQDPAVAIVEMYNEDAVLFFGTMSVLQRSPTLRARTAKSFTRWLKAKYGTEAKLLETWGPDSLNSFPGEGFTGESWNEETIVPVGNPWFFDPAQLEGSQKPKAKRLHDTMLFLMTLQNRFYARYNSAIRKAGYQGLVMSSNWIAGRAFSHFHNLNSDAQFDMVDRHNYIGGFSSGVIDNRTMLSRPGSGLLSTGMNQVAGRPFSLSEWIHVFPSEYGAEGPAILGAYGMGLQGWDVSFIFQNGDSGTWSDRIGRDKWDPVAPHVMGLFPAVSRQVLRGDVAESKETVARSVHMPSLAEGKLGFDDQGDASGDFKTSDSATVPAELLARSRMVVDFTDKFTPTPRVAAPASPAGIESSTRQLLWQASNGGRIDMATPGTRAFVGFGTPSRSQAGPSGILVREGFAAVYVTARDKGENLSAAKSLVITAIARARNKDMKVFGPVLKDAGKGPILMEPVKAEISLPGKWTVHVLDSDGRRTGRTLPVQNGVLKLDTGAARSCYFLALRG
jgi:hypothetical protein